MSQPLDLTGVYRAEGTYHPTGSAFTAEVTITKLGDVYQLQWRSGTHTWGGVGVLQGKVLAVAILSSSGNGVIAYDIVPQVDGLLLQGRWAYTSDTQVSTEILRPVRKPTSPTSFEIEELSWEDKARHVFRRD